jgi:hypothetical protein
VSFWPRGCKGITANPFEEENKHMRRFITSFAIAFGCAAIAVSAQETRTRTETRSSGGEAQVVTYTGCVAAGTEAKTYTLNKVVPVTKTTTTETPTSSTTTSTTSFVLVPGETVQVQETVGKKVEVTGTLIPAGNIRTETTTRTEREDAPDTKTRERVESRNAPAQFRVTSIKTIGSC